MDPSSSQDTIRVAAAAILAQEAALAEMESRLNERNINLGRQEEQLGKSLEEKRRQLEDLQRQVGEAREQFRGEKSRILQLNEEAAGFHREALAERERLRELRPRFIRRLKRHWQAERGDVERREVELERVRRLIEEDASRLRRERESFEQAKAVFQVESAGERDRLESDRQHAADERERLAAERRSMTADFDSRSRSLEQLESLRLEVERKCEELRAEARGLEGRVGAARKALATASAGAETLPPFAADLSTLISPTPEIPQAGPIGDYYRECRTLLDRQVAALADQRAHLAEVYERLTGAQAEWRKKQADAASEMEQVTAELQQNGEAIRERERDLNQSAERMRQERDALARMRSAAEGHAAELTLRKSVWQEERDRLRAELDERDQFLSRREEGLAELLRKWRERRRTEVEQVRDVRRAATEVRQALAAERDEFTRRSEALQEAQRALTEQALALEEARAEFLKEVNRPAAAEKRLERLRRRWEARSIAAREELEGYRARLAKEDQELRSIHAELGRREAEIVGRERDLAGQMTDLEERQRQAALVNEELAAARKGWGEQRRRYGLHLVELRAEIERLAGVLGEGATALRSAA